jgi:hypothetical protein
MVLNDVQCPIGPNDVECWENMPNNSMKHKMVFKKKLKWYKDESNAAELCQII